MSTKAAQRSRHERIEAARRGSERAHRRRLVAVAWAVGLTVIIGLVAAMMLTSSPESSTQTRIAPDFTLTNTDGESVSLGDLRGQNVLLYFSEGAGCQPCLVQMGEIEKNAKAFEKMDVAVLPIVMDSRDQITNDMSLNGVTTPFLLDDGAVSKAYSTLGNGMHAGLPGHSFGLIDKQGEQRWYGEYPSMWLAPDQLLAEVKKHLDL